jgi:hypothetical protein
MAITDGDKYTAIGLVVTLGLAFGVSMAFESKRHPGARLVPSRDPNLSPERAAGLRDDERRQITVLKGLIRDTEGKRSQTLAIWRANEERARLAALDAEERAKAEKDRIRREERALREAEIAAEREAKDNARRAKMEAAKAASAEASGRKWKIS